MTLTQIQDQLRRFRRQMLMIRVVRAGLLLFVIGAVVWATALPAPGNKQTVFLVAMGSLLLWFLLMVSSARFAQQVQAGSTLLSIGHLDDAEVWIRRALARFSLSARGKMLAGQCFASLFFRRDKHPEVVAICRELLRYRLLARVRSIWVNVRLMLADSLLMLDRVGEAYEVMRPVYDDGPLSLAERMKLLPIQLRYELAADHAGSAVQALDEKVRIAELLDSPRAALVHALLAEACRRRAMPDCQAFLSERARLYHDLDSLAERYPVIAPIAAGTGGTAV